MSKLWEKLDKHLPLDDKSEIVFRYKESASVYHYDGEHYEKALGATNAINKVVNFVTHEGICDDNTIVNYIKKCYSQEIGEIFEQSVHEIIREHNYDFIFDRLDAWDHKRGSCELFTDDIVVPFGCLREAEEKGLEIDPDCWSAYVFTDIGELKVKL